MPPFGQEQGQCGAEVWGFSSRSIQVTWVTGWGRKRTHTHPNCAHPALLECLTSRCSIGAGPYQKGQGRGPSPHRSDLAMPHLKSCAPQGVVPCQEMDREPLCPMPFWHALTPLINMVVGSFSESEEVYQRQVLSISCIVFGIVIVGMIFAAFYFKTKKQTKQIQEQLKVTQNGKTYSLNSSSIMAKSETMAQSRVQLQNYSKTDRHPGPVMEKIMESSFSGTQSFPEALSPDRRNQPIKQHRSLSSCCSPGQRTGMLHRNAFRRTPPLPRGRFNGITGPAYQQLEESRITDQDTIPCQGFSSTGLKIPQNTTINMQLPSRETLPYFNNVDQKDLVGYSSSRANSVPIIPSVGLDEACMQMQNVSEVTGIKWCKNSHSAELVNVSVPASNCLIAEQQEVKILLETVQEQIRILTNARRSEDFEMASAETANSASENTAFLPLSPMTK
uniref:Neuregulin 3 n=1 Tax=Sphenodon punctatus TaxID=8508 RepID=A0A8D0G8V2_SPHPU